MINHQIIHQIQVIRDKLDTLQGSKMSFNLEGYFYEAIFVYLRNTLRGVSI